MSDFYEDDEDPAKIRKAYAQGEHLATGGRVSRALIIGEGSFGCVIVGNRVTGSAKGIEIAHGL